MIPIGSLMVPECVMISPAVPNKEALLRLLVDALAAYHQIADPEALFADVLKREEVSPTAVGSGCAVPHALTNAVSRTIMAAAVVPEGLDFVSPDKEPVRIVFLMAGPPLSARLHLKVLSRLARLLCDEAFRSQLIHAGSPEEFLRCVALKEDEIR